MPRNPDEQELVDAIIDGQLEAKALIEEVSAPTAAKRAAKKLGIVLRKLSKLVVAKRITAEQAKQLAREAYKAIALAEFAQHANKLKDMVDRNHERQMKAVRNLKGKVHQVAPIRRADFMKRELEKRGALDEQGNLKAKGKKGGSE